MTSRTPVGIFWDAENVAPPKHVSGAALASRLRKYFSAFGIVEVLKAYADISKTVWLRDDHDLRKDLERGGVQVVQTTHKRQTDVADLMLSSDMLFFWGRLQRYSTQPPVIVLISADGDYSYTLSLLRGCGCRVHLVLPVTAARRTVRDPRHPHVTERLRESCDYLHYWEDVLTSSSSLPALPWEFAEASKASPVAARTADGGEDSDESDDEHGETAGEEGDGGVDEVKEDDAAGGEGAASSELLPSPTPPTLRVISRQSRKNSKRKDRRRHRRARARSRKKAEDASVDGNAAAAADDDDGEAGEAAPGSHAPAAAAAALAAAALAAAESATAEAASASVDASVALHTPDRRKPDISMHILPSVLLTPQLVAPSPTDEPTLEELEAARDGGAAEAAAAAAAAAAVAATAAAAAAASTSASAAAATGGGSASGESGGPPPLVARAIAPLLGSLARSTTHSSTASSSSVASFFLDSPAYFDALDQALVEMSKMGNRLPLLVEVVLNIKARYPQYFQRRVMDMKPTLNRCVAWTRHYVDEASRVELVTHGGIEPCEWVAFSEVAEALPQRPASEPCPFFLVWGACEDGAECVYNHPVRSPVHPRFAPLLYLLCDEEDAADGGIAAAAAAASAAAGKSDEDDIAAARRGCPLGHLLAQLQDEESNPLFAPPPSWRRSSAQRVLDDWQPRLWSLRARMYASSRHKRPHGDPLHYIHRYVDEAVYEGLVEKYEVEVVRGGKKRRQWRVRWLSLEQRMRLAGGEKE
eukprot:PLAT6706.1.p1 GENE.PLAT6706.1~~PLAT6706.1.p1  ORF type:complete len:759 (-),score=224.85 PLAT6706.1:1299-3575(-)